MKMHIYLSVVGSVMLLGFALSYFRDKDKAQADFYAYTESPQKFMELGIQYAEKTRTGPIAEWLVYGGEGATVMVDGLDSQGNQIIKCAFDKRTGRPWSILRTIWKDVDLSDVPKSNPRQTAEWWLKHVMSSEEGQWHWAGEGSSSPSRYLSKWRSPAYDASLSVNPKGQMIGLRVNPPNVIPGLTDE